MIAADLFGQHLAELIDTSPFIVVIDLNLLTALICQLVLLNTPLEFEHADFCSEVGIEAFRRRLRELRDPNDGYAA